MRTSTLVLGMMIGAMLLVSMAAKYEVPNGSTILVIDSEWMDPYDPCDPAYDNMYDPPARWLMDNGNSLGSLIKFNVAYARTRADKNFQLIRKMQTDMSSMANVMAALNDLEKCVEDPNDS